MSNTDYQIGQLVFVEPRLWAGINRPGGVGRIIKITRCQYGYVETVDVKYIVGSGGDTKIDLDFIKPHEELERNSRSRRGRDFYKASPAKANITTPYSLEPSSDAKIKRRRKVSPSPGRHISTIDKDEIPTVTKASTSRMTGALELSQCTKATSEKKPTLNKPPIAYVVIPPNPPDVSPLPIHNIAKNTSFTVIKRNCNEKAPYPNKEIQGDFKTKSSQLFTKPFSTSEINSVRKSPNNQALPHTKFIRRPPNETSNHKASQHFERTRPSTADLKKNLVTERSSFRHFKLPMASSRRVPLRQVFDNNMNVRQTFVNEVVGGEINKMADEPSMERAVVFDECRRVAFNQGLGQMFQEFGESVTRQALVAKLSNFSSEEVDNCLLMLSKEGQVMMSDEEIYKI